MSIDVFWCFLFNAFWEKKLEVAEEAEHVDSWCQLDFVIKFVCEINNVLFTVRVSTV